MLGDQRAGLSDAAHTPLTHLLSGNWGQDPTAEDSDDLADAFLYGAQEGVT